MVLKDRRFFAFCSSYLELWLRSSASFVVLCLLLAHAVSAQQYTFRKYGRQDGLTNLSVTCLTQDRSGYIWVCTDNGLFRHDGAVFERFGEKEGLQDTSAHDVAEDGAGRLWVGASADLYLRQDRRFVAVRPDGQSVSVDRATHIIPEPSGKLLIVDHGQLRELWQGDDGAWHSRLYFGDEQRRTLPALQQVHGIYLDDHSHLWLGCDRFICSVQNSQVRQWDAGAQLPQDKWQSFLLDRSGRLWVRGSDHVVSLDAGASAFVTRDGPRTKLTTMSIISFIADQQGRVITRSDRGLLRWQGDHWQELTEDNGITAAVPALLASRDGTLWLGTFGHGLWRWLGYDNFESWTLARGANTNSVWVELRGADNALIVATRAGCFRIDASNRAVGCDIENLPPGEMNVMAKRGDGSLWIGIDSNQLLRVAPGQRRANVVGEVPHMRQLYVDSADRLWICTENGIRMVSPGSLRIEPATLPAGVGEVFDVTQDTQGVVWFATRGGLLRWLDGRWDLIKAEDLNAAGGFYTIAIDHSGWLWLGSLHGLMHLRVQGTHIEHAEWLDNPLVAEAAVYFTQTDRRGWLWVGTGEGFVLYDGHSWRRFTEEDGLIWNDTNEVAAFTDADGTMWIGTSSGLSHVLRPDKLIETQPLDLRIERVTFGGTTLDPQKAPRLKWDRKAALDVHLAEFDFSSPGETLQVRLQGLSDEWFQAPTHDMHYPTLAPGRYTFEAYATDLDHQRTSPHVSMSFQIVPLWWQSTWFRMLALALLLTLLALAWHWRLRSLKRELKEREALLERATRDSLTKLWNRSAILEILEREMQAARAQKTALAIGLIDIDHFKLINDTYGHQAGDEVLRILGATLPAQLRSGDALGRYGGEELLVVLPDASAPRPLPLLERLRETIAALPISYNGVTISVTASFGVARFAPLTDSAEDLIGRADAALYQAKSAGRDRVEYATTGAHQKRSVTSQGAE
jgi:diguanylate cyclase (GGDEF)-like protein